MKLPNSINRFLQDERGLAAEFALVLPLLIIFVLGTIDIGIYAYRLNQAEKATQMGARYAVVTNPVWQELTTLSMVNKNVNGTDVTQGDRIPVMDFTVTCDDTACTCAGPNCGLVGTQTRDAAAFTNLATRMRVIAPGIQDANIEVDYSGSGLGYAGDPNGPDISPFVTVRLTGLEYTPISLAVFGSKIGFGDFTYTLTAEDAAGTNSN
ncbi:pilus assembly protein [Altererythrobacter arenosus]|uniref:Pilus assembly protein n=1 Tax=Altererythrobacter arenosus TaxID=3032592 RepID=A0ABY8FU30_9SPHN|nr:TadE family protein [Altererythrobacter sp. CAU 1644]WFL76626.1 pilus assembly protein [Altererythrobacter sp. CAU 1644]